MSHGLAWAMRSRSRPASRICREGLARNDAAGRREGSPFSCGAVVPWPVAALADWT